MDNVIVSGTGRANLERELKQLPAGDYSIVVYPDNSEKNYIVDITAGEIGSEGVGYSPYLIIGSVIVALAGAYFSWQILEEVSDITETVPKWAWYVGGAAVIVLLLDPLMNMISPKRKSSSSSPPQQYFSPPQQYYPPPQQYYSPPQQYFPVIRGGE